MKWLAGKKTYITMAAAVLTAIASLASGEITVGECVVAILGALGVASLRAGVAKAEKAAKEK